MIWIKKWESFSGDIELGSKISELDITLPFFYDKHKLGKRKKKVFRFEAKLGDEVIASSNYFEPDPESNFWDSYLLGVKEEFRTEPDFKNLAILMRLLTYGILERKTAISQDLSESGMGFVKKWEREGVWTTKGMSQTLTDFGVEQCEKFCKEFLNIKKINWK